MPLTISLRFPAGRYVAASWGDKDRAEWPPHPARLCLALLDACYKAACPAEEREALQGLCRLPAPEVIHPSEGHATVHVLKGVFVPQNPGRAEAFSHSRSRRSFPTVFVDAEEPAVFFHWAGSDLPADQREALARLLGRLPRFGHSSSLVMARLADEAPLPSTLWQRLLPLGQEATGSPDCQLRVPWDGLVESAEAAFDAAGRAEIKARAAALPPGRKLPLSDSRGRHDPRHQWTGYQALASGAPASSPWSEQLFLLQKESGNRLGLESTWQLTETLHKALLDRWSRDPVRGAIPSWLSGHQAASGEPGTKSLATAAADHLHLAMFPLAHVDEHQEHADGHLLGIGLAFPRPKEIGIDAVEFRLQWRHALAALFEGNEQLELSPRDKSWRWVLRPVASPQPPQALQPSRWIRPACVWATVTPVILDRHPKPHFRKDPLAWQESCRSILSASFQRLGLPEPVEIIPSMTSVVHGAPPAPAFIPPGARSGRPQRFHLHSVIRFAVPVAGPMIVGAGRYRGYGLFVPLDDRPID